ncbi:MAG TPA: CsbD family protein [Vitreimonas sp.]|nr:CsbD family protein [Vitreimonas sp.]
MDKEHVKGAADKASGATKEAAGKMTGDKSLEAEGKLDKAKAAVRDFAGDVKDDVKDEKRRRDKDARH